METRILIIGVGGGGCNAVDIMDIPNSKKLFINSDSQVLSKLKSEGTKFLLDAGLIICNNPEHYRKKALFYKNEIKECIKEAFDEKDMAN